MHDILIYFENIPTFGRTLFLVTVLSFFLIVESLTPLFRFNYHKGKHAAINITFTLITLVINLFGAAFIVAAVDYTSKNQFGILQILLETMGHFLWFHVQTKSKRQKLQKLQKS